jgi:hypothetical protein
VKKPLNQQNDKGQRVDELAEVPNVQKSEIITSPDLHPVKTKQDEANEPINNTNLTILLGLVAIVVTLVMASGEWSIFDVVVSIAVICYGAYFLREQKITPKDKNAALLFSLPFSLLTTAALIALATSLAVLLPPLAYVDSKTSQMIYKDDNLPALTSYRWQVFLQGSIFIVSEITWFFIYKRQILPQEK